MTDDDALFGYGLRSMGGGAARVKIMAEPFSPYSRRSGESSSSVSDDGSRRG